MLNSVALIILLSVAAGVAGQQPVGSSNGHRRSGVLSTIHRPDGRWLIIPTWTQQQGSQPDSSRFEQWRAQQENWFPSQTLSQPMDNRAMQRIANDLRRRDIPLAPSQLQNKEALAPGWRPRVTSQPSKAIVARNRAAARRRKLLRQIGLQSKKPQSQTTRAPLFTRPLPPPPPPQFLPPHFLENLPSARATPGPRRPSPPAQPPVVSPSPQSLDRHLVSNESSQAIERTQTTPVSGSTPSSSSALPKRPVQQSRKTFSNANDAFLKCCKEKHVDDGCESRCNFDVLSRRVLTAMFVGNDPCPQRNGRSLLSCAAQDSDHTPCCVLKNVHKTSAGDKCLGFCQMSPGSNFQADVTMLPCWAVLKDIKECFKNSIIEKQSMGKNV